MSSLTSAAEWPKLFRYSDRSLQIDRELVAEASRLASALHHFEATCTEYRVSVSHLAGDIQGYARGAEGTDVWVRKVGVEFQRADQIGWTVWSIPNAYDFLKEVVKGRADLWALLNGLRFHPYSGWRVFFRDAIFRLGYTGQWIVKGPARTFRGIGLSPAVRKFGFKYLDKKLIIKPRVLPGEAKSILRRLPRNSPYLPVSTFKQRIADMVGAGKGIKGFARSWVGITIGLSLIENIYEFQLGVNRHLGLGSRQFATATVADVSAGLSIVVAATAIGSLIPIPVVGTAVGFLVGVGLSYAYEKWGKDAWRGAVDGAGKKLQEGLDALSRMDQTQIYKDQRNIARGAADVLYQHSGSGLTESNLKSIQRSSWWREIQNSSWSTRFTELKDLKAQLTAQGDKLLNPQQSIRDLNVKIQI